MRQAIKGDGAASIDWFFASGGVASGLEAAASWRRDLSDHACMVAWPSTETRRRGDCPPRSLRQLPADAWAELRAEYAALHI
eukprot:4368703-Alexandrium_andersonii.AAC.1